MNKYSNLITKLKKRAYSMIKKNEFLSVIILFIVIFIFFFAKSFNNDYLHGDFIAYWIPNYAFIIKSIQQGQVPLWQPNILLGVPELFNSQLAIFSPGIILVLIINFFFNSQINLNFLGKSLELLQISYLLLSALGTFYLLRRQLKLLIFPAFIGGLLYSLSLFVISHIGNLSTLPGIALFPIIISVNLAYIKNPKLKTYTALVFINFLLLTFGYPYNVFYFFLAQLILGLCFGIKYFILIGFALLNSLALSAFFLIPNLYIYNNSFRGIIATINDPFFHLSYAYIPTKIVTILNPQIFDSYIALQDPEALFSRKILSWGVFSLPFLILGFSSYKYNKFNLWIIIIFILGTLISLGGYINFPQTIAIIFPFMEKFRSHWQALTLPIFAGIILISQGVHYLIKNKINKKTIYFLWKALFLIFLIIISLPYICSGNADICTTGNFDIIISFTRVTILLFFSLLLIYLFRKTKKQFFLFIGILIIILELSFYYKNIPQLHMNISYEKYYEENSLIQDKPNNDNLFRYYFVKNQFAYNASLIEIPTSSGYDPVPYPASQKISRLGDSELQFTNTKYLITTIQKTENNKLKLLKKISPSDYSKEIFMSQTPGIPYRVSDSNNNHYIYEVIDYLPRFFVPNKVISCQNDNCKSKEDPPKIVFSSDINKTFINQFPEKTHISIISYTPNEIKLKVKSEKEVFIASSEILDQGWNIEINGKKTRFYNVSDGFRGFVAPVNSSFVHMTYKQPYFYTGLIISLIGTIPFIFIYFLKIKKN